MDDHFGQLDTVILCGGLGTRLRSIVNDKPKVLAAMGDRPFFDILLESLASSGLRRFILSTGYLGDQIKEYIKSGFSKKVGAEFIFSEEEKQLGTGGALKKALPLISTSTFLVLNGDSFCNLNLGSFLNFHREKNSHVTVALVGARREDGGRVVLGKDHRITRFNEKVRGYEGSPLRHRPERNWSAEFRTESRHNRLVTIGLRPGLSGAWAKNEGVEHLNAGVYLMEKNVADLMPASNIFSLEYDFFPRLIGEGKFFGFPVAGEVIDIGTPERYKNAIKYFKEIRLA